MAPMTPTSNQPYTAIFGLDCRQLSGPTPRFNCRIVTVWPYTQLLRYTSTCGPTTMVARSAYLHRTFGLWRCEQSFKSMWDLIELVSTRTIYTDRTCSSNDSPISLQAVNNAYFIASNAMGWYDKDTGGIQTAMVLSPFNLLPIMLKAFQTLGGPHIPA